MSAYIGKVHGPHHNSPGDAAEVWCSTGGVELHLFVDDAKSVCSSRSFDPIAARNLAALLVRASEEVERMRASKDTENQLNALVRQEARADVLKRAESLWQLLDDIDTLSDSMKPEITPYYRHVMEIVEKRHAILKSDGYDLTLSDE